jgi:protein-disulfide isomerase
VKFNRRETIILAAAATALGLTGLTSANAAEGDVVDQNALLRPTGDYVDHVVGNPDAPVTVIEYASPTCPHCGTFHNTVLEPFKAAYVETGKVRFIIRPYLRHQLDAAIFMLAQAAGPDNYDHVLSTYFRTQNTWMATDRPLDAVQEIALELGFTREMFESILTNQDNFNAIQAVSNQASDEFGLRGTPTFYVNGKTLSGAKTLEQLAAEVDPLVPANFVAPAAPVATDAMAPAADAMAPAADAMAPAANAMAPAAQ